MRELVLKMQISVDGFVGGPNGEVDWVFESMDPVAVDWVVRSIGDASLHLMGSRTFHDMVNWWPTSTEAFAPPMNSIPKAVFSKQGRALLTGADTTQALKDAATARAATGQSAAELQLGAESWAETEVLSGDLANSVRRLKSADGRPIVAHGGASFARSLVATGLIDRFELMVHPIALGAGLPLFSGLAEPLKLQRISSTAFPGGAVGQVYRPA